MVHFHKLHRHRSILRARSHPNRNGGHGGHGGGGRDDHHSGRRSGRRNDHHRQLGLDQHRQDLSHVHGVHDHHDIQHMDRGERSRTRRRGHRQLIHTSQLCNQLGQSL